MEVRGGLLSSYTTSDTITIDVYLDASGSITLFSVAVLSTSDQLSYSAFQSGRLGISGGNGPGAMPSYILYAPAAGMTGVTALYPQQTPFWLTFPNPTPGVEQVNINYAEPTFGETSATGNDIWIAALVYHISGSGNCASCIEIAAVDISMSASSAILSSGLNILTDQVALSGGPIFLNVQVPEPATALLIGMGLLALGLVGRSRV